MNNEVLMKAKKAYLEIEKKQERALETMNLFAEHYKNSHEDFLLTEMNKFQNQNFADSSQMVLDAFQQIPMDELRSGIYVLFGAYMEVESGRLHIVPDPRWADWLLYYSIETDLEGKFVLPEKQVSFESTHPVIHKSLAKTKKELNRQYNQIRYLYFKSLLECDDYELEKENLVKKVQEEYDCLEKVTLVKKYTQK